MEHSIPFLTEGVQEDCENLLLEFEKMKSLRFTDFAKVWREMKFTAIFGGRSLGEIEFLVPEVLLLVKQYFIKSNAFNLKVGALYLLYGLYYKQPLKNYTKILITLSDWEVIAKFIGELRENNHFDTLVIICKLISDNAFTWSATNSIHKIILPDHYFRFGLFDTNSLIDDMDLEAEFNELKEIESRYVEAKNVLAESASETGISIKYSSDDITSELLDLLNSKAAKVDQIEQAAGPSSKSDKILDIGDRRRMLKNRCFEEGTKKGHK